MVDFSDQLGLQILVAMFFWAFWGQYFTHQITPNQTFIKMNASFFFDIHQITPNPDQPITTKR